MKDSSSERHCELMAVSVTITVSEQSAQRLRQKSEPDRKRRRTTEETPLFLGRQIRDALQIKRDRFLERTEDLLEGVALDRDVEIEADRLPIAIPAFGVAAQGP